MITKKGLINFSFFSKILTGHRTQITSNYNKKKYKSEVNYIRKFESDWFNSYRYYEFSSKSNEIESNIAIPGKIFCGIKIHLKTQTICRLYVYIENSKIYTKDDFKNIEWNGRPISKIIIDFNQLNINLK